MNTSNYLPLFADLMLKSAVVAGLACLAAWSWRQASAANRNLIWVAAFGTLLVLPFTTAWMPREERGAVEPRTVIVLKLPAEAMPSLVARPTVAAAGRVSGLRVAIDWLRDHWREGVVGLWWGVAGLLLAWRMVGAGRLRWLKRRSTVVGDARIEAWAVRIAVNHGLRRRVELRISEECSVAMTWGTLRPVVMLPADAPTWSDERIEVVLRHELAHVRRADCLARLASQVACAIYWPNPLVWLGARHLRLAQEQACDDRVLAAGAEARAYASELLVGARALSGRAGNGAAVAMAEPSTLEKRIVGIVDEGRDRSVARRLTVVVATVAAVLALAGGAAVQVRAGQEASVPVAKTAGPVRQVQIEARFIGVQNTDSEIKDYMESWKTPGASAPVLGFLAKTRAEADIRGLSKRSGSDLLSAPKITSLEGNQALISVAQEIPFPITWERSVDGAPAKPKKIDTRNVGVNMLVFPRVAADGSVELEVHCVVRDLKGFVEGRVDATGHLVAGPSDARLIVAAEAAEKMLLLPANAAYTPLFEEREVKTSLRIRPDQTAVLRLGERKAVTPAVSGDWAAEALTREFSEHGAILVFLSAREVSPFDVPVDVKRKAVPPFPPGATFTKGPYDPARFRP